MIPAAADPVGLMVPRPTTIVIGRHRRTVPVTAATMSVRCREAGCGKRAWSGLWRCNVASALAQKHGGVQCGSASAVSTVSMNRASTVA